jgi:hypothetical protein
MRRFDGSLARTLDFGDTTTTTTPSVRSVRGQLRLAVEANALQGGPFDSSASSGSSRARSRDDKAHGESDKYKALEHRRRQAQIKARRLLEV